MTLMALPLTGAPSASKQPWNAINWQHVSKEVQRLQMRIAKAVREPWQGESFAMALNTLLFSQAFGGQKSEFKLRS